MVVSEIDSGEANSPQMHTSSLLANAPFLPALLDAADGGDW